MEIVILKAGTKLRKISRRIIILEEDKIVKEIPFYEVESIIITTRGVSISSDLVLLCTLNKIPIIFLTAKGEFIGEITGPYYISRTLLRQKQLQASTNGIGFNLAKKFIYSKLKNQTNLLKYYAKTRKNVMPEKYYFLIEKTKQIEKQIERIETIEKTNYRNKLLNIEGISAHYYWEGVKHILPVSLSFPGRRTFKAKDVFNNALNYGYGILYSKIWSIALKSGIDPFTGFLHTPEDGKPSFIYDFVEEFRTMIVDKTLISMATKRFKFEFAPGKNYLSINTRREIIKNILLKLENRSSYNSKRVKLKDVISYKMYEVIKEIKGIGEHKPFIGEW